MANSNASNNHHTTIDSLPESILIYILSFLPTRDVIEASLVCHRWCNLWYHTTSLIFDIVPFHSPSKTFAETRELFVEYINHALSIRPFTPNKKFYLRFDCSSSSDRKNVDSWICRAVNCKVVELDLDFHTCDLNSIVTEKYFGDRVISFYEVDDYMDYYVDFSLFKNSFVQDLKLRKCDTIFPSNVCTTDFASIRSLTLDDLSNDKNIPHIIQGCVNLEHLRIWYISISQPLEIFASKLKKCELGQIYRRHDTTSIVIHAPNLRSILFDTVRVENYVFKETSNIVEAQVDFVDRDIMFYCFWSGLMSSLSNIKNLIVQNMYFDHEEMLEFGYNEDDTTKCYKFDNLIHLELRTSYCFEDLVGICTFLEHSPSIESLVIDYCYDDENEGCVAEEFMSKPVILNIPHLRQVNLKNYRGSNGEQYLIELLKAHQVVLQKIVVFPMQIGKIKPKSFPIWMGFETS